jgi:small ligand-binding sensory domain FIST
MSTAFRAAHASDPDWEIAVDRCLEALAPLPDGANLGFLYVTDSFADQLDEILARLKADTGIVTWTGSVGLGIIAQDREYHDVPAVSLLVGALPPGGFRLMPALNESVTELPAPLLEWIRLTNAGVAVVHGDPDNAQISQLLEELSDAIGGFLIGGLTSARGQRRQVAGGVTRGGLSGVIFSPAVAVSTGLTQGCTPFGQVHEVTECRRNIAIQLDNRPALDVFNDEVGEVLANDPARAAGYIFAALPVRGSDTGDYLVRNLLGLDSNNKLIAIGEYLSPGDALQFCRRDRKTARDDLQRMLKELLARTPGRPRAALYYSCLGRGPHMFGEESTEVRLIQEALGGIPLAGFFCNGEISHRRLYGYTGVLTLFS